MQPLLTPAEMSTVDRYSIDSVGIPGLVLMENAGAAVFHEIADDFDSDDRIAVVCGPGNNGGDGFVISRYLDQAGFDVDVYLLTRPDTLNGDAATHYQILENTGFEQIIILDDENQPDFDGYSVIIDAMFGTGFHGELSDHHQFLCECINMADAFVISVDIPSGLNGENGIVSVQSVIADRTITLGAVKTGLLLNDAFAAMDDITVVDIGIPDLAMAQVSPSRFLIEDLDVELPERTAVSHKHSVGRILIVGGSTSMSGAVSLTARAALASGAGLVKAVVPESIHHSVDQSVIEAMILPAPMTSEGTLSAAVIETILKEAEWADAVIVGMGMGTHSDGLSVLQALLTQSTPLLIDADGLNLLSQMNVSGIDLSHVLLTPHLGEFSRLTGLSVPEISRQPDAAVMSYAEAVGINVLLKGMPTLISDGQQVAFNLTGNPGMATAGAGDVLSGLIGGFMAQGLPAFDAAVSGAYLHGLAGDLARDEQTEFSLIASDLIRFFPEALKVWADDLLESDRS